MVSGTLNDNGYNITSTNTASGGFQSSSNNARALVISGTWTFAGQGNAFSLGGTVLPTVTGSGTISLTATGAKTFVGGGIQTWPKINQGGTGALTITGSNKFQDITNTAIGSVLFTGGTTNEFNAFSLNGTSTAARLTLGSTNTTQATLKKATPWNVGTGSLDSGNNAGLSFASGGNDYLSISYINGIIPSTGNRNFFAFF